MVGIHSALCGRLAKDAEMRETRSGSVLSFSVCANDREGRPPQWVRVSFWGDAQEQLADQLKKGSEVWVKGKLTLGTWTAKDTGEERASLQLTAWDVVPLGLNAAPPRPRSQRRGLARNAATGQPQPWQNDRRQIADDLMDVPF